MPFTFTMPKLSPTMESGTIVKWLKKEGDLIEPGDLVMEVATDKATVEHEAIDPGYLRKILITEGGEATVNQPIAIFTEKEDESIANYTPEEVVVTEVKPKEEKKAAPAPKTVSKEPRERVMASPLAKRIAEERGIDLTKITGTGPRNRIMKRDLNVRPMEVPGSFDEVALTPMRKVIGQRLQESKATIPHFYVTQAIDTSALFEMREQLKNIGEKITFNDLIIRAAALALREHPQVNCGFNPDNQTIIHFKTIDISLAVTIEGGLITPIIFQADHKSVKEISKESKALAARAKSGKLEEREYKGGSFTISNLGMFGTTEFKAIINPPQGAILAVSAIQDVPVVKGGQVVPGKVMNLTLSADHRIIDGVAGAEFMRTIKDFLENPASLLL